MNRAAAQPVASGIHLREYWKVVWHGRWTVIGCFLLVVGLTAVWTFLQKPIYRAAATVEVQPQANRIAAGRDVSGLGVAGYGWFAEEKYHNTQVEILTSRDVAERVFRLLGLADHPEFKDLPDAIGAFRSRIVAIPRRETGIIEISMTGPSAENVTEWVNAVANAYVDRNIEIAKRNVRSAVDTIKDQLGHYTADVSIADAARFDALRGDSTAFASEDQVEIVKSRLRDYNADLNKNEIELSRLGETLRRIRELQRDDADVVSLPELADDVALRELYQQRVRLDLEMERAKVELRPGHQQYQKAESELVKVRQRIQERVSTILGSVQQRYDITLQHVEYLHREIRAAEQDSVSIARGKSKYDLKKTEAEAKKGLFDLIQKTIDEVNLGLVLLSNNVSVLDAPTKPLYPIKPKRKLNLLVGGLFGLFLGIGAAFFLDYLDNTFRTPEDLERMLGLSVLGLIPKMNDDGLAARAANEAYQSLRTSVIFSSKNHRRRVILVTSTGPQEGKSSTTANLARTLVAAGDRVIVVDGDLRRPVQHAIHGKERDPGLTNYLAAPLDAGRQDVSWSSYVRVGEPPNLHLLACGPIPPSPPELLGSDRFLELVAALRESYDWVLLDSPPAATLADATQLAAVADMVILVIRHAHTDRDLVGKTLQRLRAVNPNVVGAVLNNVDIARASNKDYYYAGAYYYQADDGKRRSTRKRRAESKAGVN